MALLNGTTDLPANAFSSTFRRPEGTPESHPGNVLYHLADCVRSATISSLAHDTARTVWGVFSPVWLQRRRRIRFLEQLMSEAGNLDTYEACALELDDLQNHDEWKLSFHSVEDDYNPKIIRKQIRRLLKASQMSDIGRLQYLLRTQLSRDLGGMNIDRLYKHSWHGTKTLISEYIDTVVSSIDSLLDLTDRANLPAAESRFHQKSLEDALRCFGRSALTLSGGAKLGMKHIGVVKALWEADLLPNIISGASAGAVVAAVISAHSDSEMQTFLSKFPESDLAVFDPSSVVGPVRWCATRCLTMIETHAWFNMDNLERVMKTWVGSLTFKEAHNKTGRIVNICVSSPDSSEPRLLNFMTAPNVFLWSAVCASCSVPYVFQPANIYERDVRTGQTVVWMQGSRQWVDGSLDSDIPQRKLSEMFNVNFFIVSQVNPHIRPFLVAEEEFRGIQPTTKVAPTDTVLRRIATLAKDDIAYRANLFSDSPMLKPLVRGVSILTQTYTGDVNILPEIAPSEYLHMMTNPTPQFIEEATDSGMRAAWPKMPRIRNSVAIEIALLKAINVFRDRVNFGPDAAKARQKLRSEANRGRSRNSRRRQRSFSRRRSLSNEWIGWGISRDPLIGPPSPSPHREFKRNSSAGSLVDRLGGMAGLTPMESVTPVPTLTPQAGVSDWMTTRFNANEKGNSNPFILEDDGD
jgi:TAG lipase / steryl ester hydrolase / phospholipase A2 / LPA acyltransferase